MDSQNSGRIDQCYRLLALCARGEAHPLMDDQLARRLEAFRAWELLPAQAELHGMAPLLWHHIQRIGFALPAETKRVLVGLYLRHRALNQAHTKIWLEVSSLLQQGGIRAVALKGLALAHEYYPEPALRPVSDLDLLLKTDEVLPALDVLERAGFHVNRPLPASQTPGLLPKEVAVSSAPRDGVVTRIEIHHHDPRNRSAVDNSLDDEFVGFDLPPRAVHVDGVEVFVPHPMNTLDYLVRHFTRHMFVATDESPLQLKWLADVICLAERHAHEIDWNENQALLRRLEVLYSLSPMPAALQNVIPVKQVPPPAGVNRYPKGWPQNVIPSWKKGGLLGYFKRALASPAYLWYTLSVPSPWWLQLQYGIEARSVFWHGQVVYRLQVLRMAFAKLARTK